MGPGLPTKIVLKSGRSCFCKAEGQTGTGSSAEWGAITGEWDHPQQGPLPVWEREPDGATSGILLFRQRLMPIGLNPPVMIRWTGTPVSGSRVRASSIMLCWISNHSGVALGPPGMVRKNLWPCGNGCIRETAAVADAVADKMERRKVRRIMVW